MQRLGVTIPFEGVPLLEQRSQIARLADLGYTDVWSAEAAGADGFTPLALASVWAPSLRVGVAIIPVFTRGPATLAISAATLASAAPGRFVLGVGTSSDIIVEQWNGIPFRDPYRRVQDTVRFLRSALVGDKINERFSTFTVNGFKAGLIPDTPPPILVAALRKGMLRLAGREADGAILTWLSAEDVKRVVPFVHQGGEGKEIVARIVVAPTTDRDAVHAIGRTLIATYLNVPVYAAFHEWLGRGERLQPMWKAWKAGDRRGAIAAVPESVIDELIIHGSPEECRAHIQRYVDNGVHTPVLAVMRLGGDLEVALRDLAGC